jgi:hypothetical protein
MARIRLSFNVACEEILDLVASFDFTLPGKGTQPGIDDGAAQHLG